VRGAYVVNSLVGFDIDPVVVSKTTTRKGDEVCPFTVDNCELQITVERYGVYRFPFHDGRWITH
jgi:hypothetical protein